MFNFFNMFLCFFCFFKWTPEDYRGKILDDFDKKQEKEGYNFLWREVRAPDKLLGYRLYYVGYKLVSTEQARVSLITNMEHILAQLNGEPHIKESLYRYPFKPEDIDLMYVNVDKEGVVAKKPYVRSVSTNWDKVQYRFAVNDNINDDELVVESYNDAFEKVYGHPRDPLCEPKPPKKSP